MIDQLLGEDNWPELKSLLKEFAVRTNTSENVFCKVSAKGSPDLEYKVVSMVFTGLCGVPGAMSSQSGNFYYSLDEVFEIIHNGKMKHSFSYDSYLAFYKSAMIRRIVRNKVGYNVDKSLFDQEVSDYKRDSKGLKINDLYLKMLSGFGKVIS